MSTPPTAKIPRRSEPHDPVESNDESAQSTKDQSVNSHIELTYDDLTMIFKNLNAEDLCSAARVCRCWYEVANNEKKVRRSAPFTLLDDFDQRSYGPLQAKALIRNFKIKPTLSMAFTRLAFASELPLPDENIADCLCTTLPTNSLYIRVGNSGIVKDELECQNVEDAVLMLLPRDNDVSIDAVYCPIDETYIHPSQGYSPQCPKSCRKKLEKFANAKNKVKCFVMFSSEECKCDAAILRCMPRDNERTVSGSVVSGLGLCKNSKKEVFCTRQMEWIVLMISGSSVQSWSVILQRTIDTKEKIEEKLRKFRKQVQLKKKCMAFMFACQGRGEYKFHERNVESTIFKKVFPEVPLVGCSGGGEYGDSSIDHLTDRIHQYSTVFMIVTYGQS